MIGWSVGRLVGCISWFVFGWLVVLAGWLVSWLIGWLVGFWLVSWLVGCLVDLLVGRWVYHNGLHI